MAAPDAAVVEDLDDRATKSLWYSELLGNLQTALGQGWGAPLVKNLTGNWRLSSAAVGFACNLKWHVRLAHFFDWPIS
jgi:hypothetical protein